MYGYDGLFYFIGAFVTFIPVLLFVAEACRHLGRYTLADVLAYRNNFRASKLAAAISSIVISIFYLIPQIVGGAILVKILIGIEYEVSVSIVGILMLIYVFFGGMHTTTWIQIIKAILLLVTCLFLVMLSWAPYGFSIVAFFDALGNNAALQQYLHTLVSSNHVVASDLSQRFFEPGLYLKNPLEQFSLGFALIFGTAGMPHVLMRFFTVPDARSARSSVLWGMLVIGVCHLLIIAIGFAAAHYIGASTIVLFDKGGNLATPLLAQLLGGGRDSFMGNLFLGFTAAVAFATIVAVVAGLTLAAASALAHDIYVGAIKNGRVSPVVQARAAKIATVIVSVFSIGISLTVKGQNVAHLAALAFAVAASANFPALLLTLYWKRCNTAGVIAGVIGGMLTAVVLVLISPNMQYPALLKKNLQAQITSVIAEMEELNTHLAHVAEPEKINLLKTKLLIQERLVAARYSLQQLEAGPQVSIVGLEQPLITLKNPGIISIPIGFCLVIFASLLWRDKRSHNLWREMRIRRYVARSVID